LPYARLLHHVVWATKKRTPTIPDAMVEVIREAIIDTSRGLDVSIYAVGVMPAHVHVFAQIPPTIEVSRVIGRWKGASSHAVSASPPTHLTFLCGNPGTGCFR